MRPDPNDRIRPKGYIDVAIVWEWQTASGRNRDLTKLLFCYIAFVSPHA